MICFFKRADPFYRVYPFCFFVDFKIYVTGTNWRWVDVMARYAKAGYHR